MKSMLVVLAFISLAGMAVLCARIMPARAVFPRTGLLAAESCVDRYNSLVKNAKAALIAGDRAATIHLLAQAERIIPVCPALRDAGSQPSALLSLNAGQEPYAAGRAGRLES